MYHYSKGNLEDPKIDFSTKVNNNNNESFDTTITFAWTPLFQISSLLMKDADIL